jgi:hypothetical protein
MERKVQNQEELEPSKSTGQKGMPYALSFTAT